VDDWQLAASDVLTLNVIKSKDWEVAQAGPIGWGFSAGTFGELVFGALQNTSFLITLPIPWGTRATFAHDPGASLNVWPSYRHKARRAVEELLRQWDKPIGGQLVIQSSLPVGKGLASSSADIVASCRACAAFFGRKITSAEIARISAAIEPTDGIMFPGVVAFDPIRGVLLERLGEAPPAMIVGVLGHGRINTEDHHRRLEPYTPEQQARLSEALQLARAGVRTKNVRLLGRAGRISATVEWERRGDDSIGALLAAAERENAGVVIGHSGTVRGLLVGMPQSRAVWRRLEQGLLPLGAGPAYRIPVAGLPAHSLSGRTLWSVPEPAATSAFPD
jgi:uncharacterized protein involved in propanediol utilization